MSFSVSNDGIEWSLEFGQDSMTLTVKDLVQKMTISSQEIPLAAWSLLLSQRQQFLKNHPARFPVTPKQQGTHEMRDEVFSSVGAQKGLDTSGYQVSAILDDVDFSWENDQLDVDAVSRAGIDTPFSPTVFAALERKPYSARRRGRQGELYSNNNNTSLWEKNTTPCIAEKSSIGNKNRKSSWLCLKTFVSIGIAGFVI